jgi:large subunit ribosomal protein L4
MATETSYPPTILHDIAAEENVTIKGQFPTSSSPQTSSPLHNVNTAQVLTTIYSWPTLEPVRFDWYHSKHLYLPMRRDILHRAVVFEGDATRQGTASTKWRKDVHGSGRKIRPQKGTGRARLGDKKSPMLRGGGVAFGPHPRDFSTGLQRKVYDLAWRTALSYRYKKGELIILDNKIMLPRNTGGRLLSNVFEGNEWGKANGRSLLVTGAYRERLFKEMEEVGEHGLVKDIYDVDVKDLLETGRIVIEKHALDTLLFAHASDLGVTADLGFALSADKTVFLKHATSLRQATQEGRLAGIQRTQEQGQGVVVDESDMTPDVEGLQQDIKTDLSPAPAS